MGVLTGTSFSDLMTMTLSEINILADSYVYKREIQGQDSMYIAYTQSLLISTAMWSPKDLPKSCPEFRIRPYTDDEIEQQVYNEMMLSYNSLSAIMEDNIQENNYVDTEEQNKIKAKQIYETIEDMGYTMGG